jgi:hypothetical protein
MSLYANINVSKAQEEAVAVRQPPVKSSKSAALYAGVLAKPPPPPKQTVSDQHTISRQDAVQSIDVEVEKPTEASGKVHKDGKH